MIHKAKEAYTKNKFEEALRLFQEAQQIQPDDLDVLEGMARSYYRLKRFSDATDYCNQALSIDESLAWPYLILSYVYFLQKKLIESKQYAKVALEIDASGWEANFWWGSLLSFENKTDEGLIFLEKAAATEKNNWYLYNNLSIAYFNKGNLDKYYDARKQMNRIKPSIFNTITIHMGRWAILYSVLMVLAHYIMILLAFVSKVQVFLVIPFIIDALWITIGVWYVFHRQYKRGVNIVLAGLFNSIFTVIAYMALNR